MAEKDHVKNQSNPDSASASQGKLERITEFTDEAVISIDQNQKITFFNHAAEKIFGYSREEALERPLSLLIPPILRELHACHVRRFLDSPEIGRTMGIRQEITVRRKEDSTFPANAALFKSRLPDGEIELTALLRDISEDKYLKQLRESLRVSREIQLHFFRQKYPRYLELIFLP